MRYFLSLVLLLSGISLLMPMTILFLAQYGPIAVYGFIASMLGIAFFLNNARKSNGDEWISEGVSRSRREKALEQFIREVRARRVED